LKNEALAANAENNTDIPEAEQQKTVIDIKEITKIVSQEWK